VLSDSPTKILLTRKLFTARQLKVEKEKHEKTLTTCMIFFLFCLSKLTWKDGKIEEEEEELRNNKKNKEQMFRKFPKK
jgi:hypothetical protein